MKSKRSSGFILLAVASLVVALIGLALLITNILVFKSSIAMYIAQGYTFEVVAEQLIPGQLLPGVFEPIGIYGGIAFALWGIALLNKKMGEPDTAAAVADDIADTESADPEETAAPEIDNEEEKPSEQENG